VQDEIAGLIAQAMQVKLGMTAPLASASGQARIPAAYDAYLQARGIENREWYNEKSSARIVALLEKAVELDPDFALGWAQLSFAHVYTYFANLDHTEARLTEAKTALDTAYRLAPDSPAVFSSFGNYYYYGFRDYDRAREYFERAGRLLPNSPVVAFYMGDIDRRQARWASALANLRRAVELDPINTGYLNVYRSVLSAVRRYDESLAISRRQLALNPDSEGERLGHAYAIFTATGSKKDGDELFARMPPEVFDSPRMVSLRKAWAFYTGDFDGFIRLDRRQPYLEEGGAPRYQQALFAAIAYEAQGDVAAARARLAGFPEQMRTRLEGEPNNSDLWQRLAQIEAILGHADEAERCIARALALVPEGRDAVEGIDIARSRAFVLARTGRRDEAIAEYARLLGIPGSPSLHSLRHGAFWAILRGDPKWEAVLADPKNIAPLY
jgi:tetratricopeptide (TPR) repeat protein